jgi:hypothetical protein
MKINLEKTIKISPYMYRKSPVLRRLGSALRNLFEAELSFGCFYLTNSTRGACCRMEERAPSSRWPSTATRIVSCSIILNKISVSDPDPYWILIQSGQRIRIKEGMTQESRK